MTNIVVSDLETEIKNNYIEYAQSSNARALTDVRDGLKSVHRRSLFAASEITPSSGKYVKSARLVGHIIGLYHPHGDVAVYEAIVRMSQEFNNNCTYFDTQGSFGYIDGSKASAQRYTELKLNSLAEWLCGLDLLKYDCVQTIKNYSGEIDVPLLLPVRLPLHLLNGVPQGSIGNGYATCCPPHNIQELCAAANYAVYYYIFNNSEASLDEIMQFMPAPDFPTGGYICNSESFKKLYTSGKGTIKIRAKTHVEEGKNNKIVVTEIPYGLSIEDIILDITEKSTPTIKEKTKEKVPPVIEGIKSVFDESGGKNLSGNKASKCGINLSIVIELEKNANPSIVLEKLYKYTLLEHQLNCSLNMLNEKNNVQQYSLTEILYIWAKFRVQTQKKAVNTMMCIRLEELHLIQGLLKLLNYSDISYIVNSIRKCNSNDEVVKFLMESLGCTNKQALKIAEMKLTQLSNLNYNKIVDRQTTLEKELEELKIVFTDKNVLYQWCSIPFDEKDTKFILPHSKNIDMSRKSEIIEINGDVNPKDLIKSENYVITLTKGSIIKRILEENIQRLNRNSKGNKKSIGVRPDDVVIDTLVCHSHDTLIAISNTGYAIKVDSYTIPDKGVSTSACGISNGDELIIGLIPYDSNEEADVLFIFNDGYVKRVNIKDIIGARNKRVMCLNANKVNVEKIVSVIKINATNANEQIILNSAAGLAMRLNLNEIKQSTITSKAIKKFVLRNKDYILDGTICKLNDKPLILIYSDALIKFINITDINLNIPCYLTNNIKPGAHLLAVRQLSNIDNNIDELLIIAKSGKSIRVSTSDLMTNRKTGLYAMDLSADDHIVSASLVSAN